MAILTTRNLKSPAKVESQKLSHITTAIIPNAAPQPEPVASDPSRMITTHDDPVKVADSMFEALGFKRADRVDVKVDEPIDVAPPVAPAPKAAAKPTKPRKPRKVKTAK
jgi:hypothetical protein